MWEMVYEMYPYLLIPKMQLIRSSALLQVLKLQALQWCFFFSHWIWSEYIFMYGRNAPDHGKYVIKDTPCVFDISVCSTWMHVHVYWLLCML